MTENPEWQLPELLQEMKKLIKINEKIKTVNEKTNKNKRIQNLRFIEAMLNYQLRLDISSLSFAAFS